MKNASRISIAALCAAAALGLAGCNSPSSGTAPEVAPVQVQAQDLTPMQKAAGVYTRISEYGGRDTFEDGGQWTIDEKGVVTMTPAVKGGQPSLARVEEGAVRLLNADGDAVEGPMADLYVLKKDQ